MTGTQTVEGVSSAFNEEAVEARTAGAPAWLAERRRAAWQSYLSLPLPTTRLEEWRYTDPKRLAWNRVALAEPGRQSPLPEHLRAHLASRDAVARAFRAGTAATESAIAAAVERKGLVVTDLAVAVRTHEGLVREHLGGALPAATGKFVALNAALWSGGLFIHVPRGLRLDHPIRVVHWVDQPGLAYLPRTLLVVEEGAHIAVVEEFTSPDFDEPVFVCGAAEVYAAASAEVQYVTLQRFGRGVRHLSMQRTVAQRDASLDTLTVNLGATVARVELAASLEGPGARSDMLGLCFGHADQHFDHETRQDHRVPHASSDLLYKGALTDRASSVFRGLIKVWPKAQRTDAYQTSRNLILSPHAQATSLPNLEIEADDVRCSHAATVGHLDDEELFYIMSRGIPRTEAERLVVFGFFSDVLKRLPMPGVVRELRDAIEARIG
jgi:Fe-S cluster assembly protein SufD